MAKITRDQLVGKHDEFVAMRKNLQSKKYEFKTTSCCAGFGQVKSMDIAAIMQASVKVHENSVNLDERIKQYGITEEDMKGLHADNYQGHSIQDWDHDFALRVEQIHNKRTIEKLTSAIKMMEKHFSADDQFLIDMQSVGDLLGTCEENTEAATKTAQ